MKEIVIKGTIDELVECEFYLIMVMGYDTPDEAWNNWMTEAPDTLDRIIIEDEMLRYHWHPRENLGITAKQFLSQFK